MSKEDLIPVRTKEEAKEKGRIGGIKSGIARREKKALADRIQARLASIAKEKGLEQGADVEALVRIALDPDSKKDDIVKATKLLWEFGFEKPKQSVEHDGHIVCEWRAPIDN